MSVPWTRPNWAGLGAPTEALGIQDQEVHGGESRNLWVSQGPWEAQRRVAFWAEHLGPQQAHMQNPKSPCDCIYRWDF